MHVGGEVGCEEQHGAADLVRIGPARIGTRCEALPLRLDVDALRRPGLDVLHRPLRQDGPGATALMRMPSGPSSSAIAFVKPQIACFDVV